MRSIKDAALAFDRACSAATVPYALIGGFAVMAWGQPRATMDVDALVRLDQDSISALVAACRREDLRFDPADIKAALAEGGHATAFDVQSHYHIDVAFARTSEERAEVDAAIEVEFQGGKLRIARPEDTIAYKLVFGSPQDIADARSIVVRQATTLERRLLRSLCNRLGVRLKLEALLKDSDTFP